MQDFAHKKIVLGICGGIAAYKSAYLVRALKQVGADVRVVMTTAAQAFITPLTLQALSGHDVRCDRFDTQAEAAMGHIELARWANYLLIAPATANCLAKFAHGIADDLLSTLYLVADVPVIICPAMNRQMWLHPATQANCSLLKERGAIIIGPASGEQACGEVGFGRLSEPETIITALRLHAVYQLLADQTVLITAGPTREMIDPVRYLTNHSSGKMGYALAEAAHMAGAHVILISGPTALTPPIGIDFYQVNSATAMLEAVMLHLQTGAIFIGAAAVADYGVASPELQKIKKQHSPKLTLTLTPNPDILAAVVASKKAAYVVGFAAETESVLSYAREKRLTKQVDMMIANQVSEHRGFNTDENEVTIITKQKEFVLPMMHKTRLAGQIIAMLTANLPSHK